MCVGDQRSVMEPPRPSPVRTTLNGISGAVRDPQFWRDVGGNTSRAAQGLTSGVLGAPVDIASAAVRPFAQMAGHSMPPESVVGSSEWIGNKMGQDVESLPWLIGSFGPVPDATDAMRMASMGDKLLPLAGMAGATVFHGTPHRFAPEPDAPLGKFRLDKLGTGEGSQAYGHGIYAAESPSVARQYQVALSEGAPSYEGELSQDALSAVRQSWFNTDFGRVEDLPDADLREWLRIVAEDTFNEMNDFSEVGQAAAARVAEEIMSINPRLLRTGRGTLYEADLPDEQVAKMLDWDAPLSEQPESVRKALENVPGVGLDPLVGLSDGDAIRIGSNARLFVQDDPDFGRQYYFDPGNNAAVRLPESDVRNLLGSGTEGKSVYEMLSTRLGSQQAASERLRELGIPGIRYLDGLSRTVGEGTRNYVMFDPSTAKITKRDGKTLSDLFREEALPDAARHFGIPQKGFPRADPDEVPMFLKRQGF
jgi:hypothetical protein